MKHNREGRVGRLLCAGLGLLLAGAGGYALVVRPDLGWQGAAVGLVLAVVGLEALIAALRGRASWLSRIGPLP